MVLWDIERAEVMKVIFNFRAQLYLKAGLSKNILNVVERLSDGMKASLALLCEIR